MTPAVRPVPGKPNLLLGAYDIGTLGYRAQEFFVSGTAVSYRAVGEVGMDGRWTADESGTADYTTRIVVLTPEDDAAFSGTVVVEWLNVSGGIDAPAFWSMAHREITRAGHAFVGVSAQRVGVEGGLSLGADMSLKKLDRQRYSELTHPGDGFSFDIYSQAGRLVRDGIGGPRPEHVLAVGESQSATFLTTYVNAVDPIAQVYDGFLVHSRFGPAAPLDGSTVLDFDDIGALPIAHFRDDARVPIVTVITETDLVDTIMPGYHHARQSDNDRFRAWEMPGTSHADNYTIAVGFIDNGAAALDDLVAAWAPTNMLMGQYLSHQINFSPVHHYVLQAAIAGLHDWVRTGRPPATAAHIALSDSRPAEIVRDEHGLAVGGVRTPWVDVPVASTSGAGGEPVGMEFLFGRGEVFDADTLRRLYPGGRDDYLARFTEALDRAIEAGHLLPADRGEILQLAAATYPA